MNEYEAHESSYDHQHKKRLKEMKAMQRDPLAVQKARKAERKADEKSGLISIKPVKIDLLPSTSSTAGGSGVGGGGFKKGGFRNAFASENDKDNEKEEDKDKASHDAAMNDGSAHEGGGQRGMNAHAPRHSEDEEEDEEDEDEDENEGDWGYEYYDPRRPTDCGDECEGRMGTGRDG